MLFWIQTSMVRRRLMQLSVKIERNRRSLRAGSSEFEFKPSTFTRRTFSENRKGLHSNSSLPERNMKS